MSSNSVDDFTKRLREETQHWEAENLLTPQQRQAILRRYENQPGTQSPALEIPIYAVKEFPLFIRVVLALAVFLIGLAAFLLISFNWEDLSGFAKLSIVGTVLAAAHGGGFLLRTTGWKHWADAAFFFAGIMYGVGIWQIGQVFHIPADWAAGLWLWAFGVFLLALCCGSTVLHLLATGLLAVWLVAILDSYTHEQFLFGIFPFFAYSLPIFVLFGIISGSMKKNQTVLLLYFLLFGWWWYLQGVVCNIAGVPLLHIIAVGLICLALPSGFLIGTHRTILRCIGYLLVFGGLMTIGFLGIWRDLLYYNLWNFSSDFREQYMLLSLFWAGVLPCMNFVLLFGLIRWENSQEYVCSVIRQHKVAAAWLACFFVLWICTFVCSYLTVTVTQYDVSGNLWAFTGMFAANILIVWLAIGLILNGMKQNRSGRFWGGVLFFLFWAIIRYFDLFSDVGGMLGAAAIFLFCGLFMLGIAFVWVRNRRKFSHVPSLIGGGKGGGNTVNQFCPHPNPPPGGEGNYFFLWLATVYAGIQRISQSERLVLTGIVLSALVQFTLLGMMIANEVRPLRTGTAIKVTTVPVDPRDLLRGDYVVLSYEFSDVDSLPGFNDLKQSGPVYVSMKQDGELWKPTGISSEMPKEGIFLRGSRRYHWVTYGIESYFVQEGKGLEIEKAMRQDRASVVVELMVASNGQAKTSLCIKMQPFS